MKTMTLESLKDIFDRNFSPPFVEAGKVTADFVTTAKEKTLRIQIGPRDVWINEEGSVTGAGTMIADSNTTSARKAV